MSVVGIKDYKFKNKNVWRKRVWNEIASRVDNKRKANVLYLAAEQDLDRSIAVSKGFNQNRMFAVDFNADVVESLRKQKKAAIHGDFVDVIANFNDKIDVIFADFCCGLSEDFFLRLTTGLLSENAAGATILLNFQRGREKLSEDTKIFYMYLDDMINDQDQCYTLGDITTKHRGFYFFEWYRSMVFVVINEVSGGEYFKSGKDEFNAQVKFITDSIPKTFFYKSGVYMDSIIFKNSIEISGFQPLKNDDLKKSISAQKAIATMRMKGKLDSSPLWSNI